MHGDHYKEILRNRTSLKVINIYMYMYIYMYIVRALNSPKIALNLIFKGLEFNTIPLKKLSIKILRILQRKKTKNALHILHRL